VFCTKLNCPRIVEGKTHDAHALEDVLTGLRSYLTANIKPVNGGDRCSWCERVKKQTLGHFDGEGGCPQERLARALAEYDEWLSAAEEEIAAREPAAVG